MAKQRTPKTKAKPAKRTKPKTSKVKAKAKAKAKAKPAKAKTKAKAKPRAKAKPKAPKRQRATTLPEDGVPAEVLAAGSGSNGPPPAAAKLEDEILAMARRLYGRNKTDAELLAFDPNDVDAMDPSIFYEMLQERYGVQPDPTNDYFGGFGGTLEQLISFVTKRWDGTTNKATEEPPSEWLGDFVQDGD